MFPISDRPLAGDNDSQGGHARRGSTKAVPKLSSGERLITKKRINPELLPSLTTISKKRVRVLKKSLSHSQPSYKASKITSNEDSHPTSPSSLGPLVTTAMEGEADPARDVVSLHPTSPAEPVVVYHDQGQLTEQLEEEETVWSNSVSDERRAMTSWVISQRRAYGRRTSIWERSLSLPVILSVVPALLLIVLLIILLILTTSWTNLRLGQVWPALGHLLSSLTPPFLTPILRLLPLAILPHILWVPRVPLCLLLVSGIIILMRLILR